MNHSGTCDTAILRPARRSRNAHSPKTTIQAAPSTGRRTEPARAGAAMPTFAEDFLLEHSHSALSIDLFETVESYRVTSRDSQVVAQFYGFPS